MTGKGFNLIGLSLKTGLSGADLNSRLMRQGSDTAADPRSRKNNPYAPASF